MNIFLQTLILTNFKGIRSQRIEFGDVTTISGPNASGKSTINDAFTWLLFDKDSAGRGDFEIKTLDPNNEPYHKLDHEVTGIFLFDGVETTLRKCYREKWVKPRGKSEEYFEGNECTYFWNDVPVKKQEYQAKIAELINENTFRMITNPLHFNQIMKWQDRRKILVDMAGAPDDRTIIDQLAKKNGGARYAKLLADLGKKTVVEMRAQLGAEKKKIKNELDQIPVRISEANRSMPDPVDYDHLHEMLSEKEGDLQIVEAKLGSLSDQEKAHQARLTELAKRKGEILRAMNELEFQAKESVKEAGRERVRVINEKNAELETLRRNYSGLVNDMTGFEKQLARLDKIKASLLDEYKAIKAESFEFNDQEFCCPTCKRQFDDVDIEAKKAELEANFNQHKSKRLEENVDTGKEAAKEIEIATKAKANLADKTEKLKADGEFLKEVVRVLTEENQRLSAIEGETAEREAKESPAYKALAAELESINKEQSTDGSDNGKAVLQKERSQLQTDISNIKDQLATQGMAEKIRDRIKTLEEQERTMAQQLADLEAQEFGIEDFVRAQMTYVEEKVNGMFSFVRFKMFDKIIKGGESETCEALINGVPFADANTAAKINAGLDVINTLSKFYGVTAPIFIDNRESVLNIPKMEAQVIGLFVSDLHRELTVVVGNNAMAAF